MTRSTPEKPRNRAVASVDCRPGCAACCIAPSITSLAKPAGVSCRHLTGDLRCALFGRPERPGCCSGLQPSTEMCGDSREQALHWLAALEAATRPG
ncbi:MAG: YkgJ family cysteine cluster protein [Betaproteobacteria bacterium]|nr:YkgJ family cysteine cluster protein [Betaproteobacteria bacterium]